MLALVTVAVAGVAALPANAQTPFAGQVQSSTGSVSVVGSDGRSYAVTFTLQTTDPATGPATGGVSSQVSVAVARCTPPYGCSTGLAYEESLPASAVTYNSGMTSVTVQGSFGGAPLSLTWTVNTPTGTVSSGFGPYGGGDFFTDPKDGGNGSLSATLWHLSCTGPGSVTNYVGAAPSGVGPLPGGRAPSHALAEFVTSRGHHPRCAPVMAT